MKKERKENENLIEFFVRLQNITYVKKNIYFLYVNVYLKI